jgi:hypothetical protein
MRKSFSFRSMLASTAAAFAVLAVVGGSAAPIRAAEASSSRTFDVGTFDRIEVRGAFTVEIVAGAESTRVVATSTQPMLDRITAKVKDRTLVIDLRSGTTIDGDLAKIAISLPALRAFTNSGAGMVKIAGLTGGDVSIENDGAATIDASGRAAHESISLNGAGKIDATGVDARDVTVDNNGVGGVYVRASGALAMNVNGVGEIRYKGNPTHIDREINGIGRIERM